MPGYDRSGPRGEGPLSGRGMGRCGGSPPDDWWRGRGRGGFGRGGGFGWGRQFRGGWGHGRRGAGGRGYGRGPGGWGWDVDDHDAGAVARSPEDEMRMLRRDADYLEQALDAVRDKMASLEKQKR